jgi:hypothetical protein
MDPSLNFAIIDNLCRTDRKEAARISQGLLVQISDMAILFDILESINLRPVRDVNVTQKHADKMLEEEHYDQFIKKINAPFGDNEIGDKLGEFLERACTQYPWPRGRKSLEWLQEANAAQNALDVFWSEMRLIWARRLRQEGKCAEAYVSILTVHDYLAEKYTNSYSTTDQRGYRWPHAFFRRRKASGRTSSSAGVCSPRACTLQTADYRC